MYKNKSTLGKNIRFVAYKCNTSVNDILSQPLNNAKVLYRNMWLQSVEAAYFDYAKVIKEMVLMKEGVMVKIFDDDEINTMITTLCTI